MDDFTGVADVGFHYHGHGRAFHAFIDCLSPAFLALRHEAGLDHITPHFIIRAMFTRFWHGGVIPRYAKLDMLAK